MPHGDSCEALCPSIARSCTSSSGVALILGIWVAWKLHQLVRLRGQHMLPRVHPCNVILQSIRVEVICGPALNSFASLPGPGYAFAPYHRKPRPESSKSLTASSFSAACMKCSGAARERGRHKMCSLEFGTAQRSKKHGKSISIIISPQMWLILDFLEIP